jgi:hypothetical protein
MKEYTRDSVEFIRIGYHDACIDFTVKFREWSGSLWTNRFMELKQAINAAGEYNEFDPSKVIKAIEQVDTLIDEVQFGREGSPVMYLRLISGTWDEFSKTFRKHTSAKLHNLEKHIRVAFSDTAFDEWSRERNVIRVWWD